MERVLAGGVALYLAGVATGLGGALWVIHVRIRRIEERERLTDEIADKVAASVLRIPN